MKGMKETKERRECGEMGKGKTNIGQTFQGLEQVSVRREREKSGGGGMAVAAVHNRRALTTTAAWRAMRDSQSAA